MEREMWLTDADDDCCVSCLVVALTMGRCDAMCDDRSWRWMMTGTMGCICGWMGGWGAGSEWREQACARACVCAVASASVGVCMVMWQRREGQPGSQRSQPGRQSISEGARQREREREREKERERGREIGRERESERGR